MKVARRLLIFLLLCSPAGAAFAQPALIPLPSAIVWHDGSVPISSRHTCRRTRRSSGDRCHIWRANLA